MKKAICILTIVILTIACKEESKMDYVLLSGKVENLKAQELSISNQDFKKNISISQDGSFTDTLYLERNGYYSLSLGEVYTPVFIENSDVLTIIISPEQPNRVIAFRGDGKERNNYLFAKYTLEENLRGDPKALYALEEDRYVGKQKSIKNALDSLLTTSKLDGRFEKLEKDNIFYAYGSELLKYPFYHEYYTNMKDFRVSENFYDELKSLDYNDMEAYKNIPNYRELVIQKFGDEYNKHYKENRSISKAFLNTEKNFPRGRIKDDLIALYGIMALTADENMDITYNKLMEEVQNEDYKIEVEEKYQKVQNLVQGKPSPTFEYENYKGGTTKLEDLRGKYIYIDVWATWCGLCKAEIPYLEQLEKDYRDKNIEFVSISIDSKKDREIWKRFVDEEGLGGIQLIADSDWESKFIAAYAIDGIPRFILINPEGNIVNSDAPIPSEKEDITSLFKELKL